MSRYNVLKSLERRVIDLAKDKNLWSESEFQELSARVRQGDLTTVLKVYEGDIKSPVRSAVSGTLVRSLLIQIQKAKVGPSSRILESYSHGL